MRYDDQRVRYGVVRVAYMPSLFCLSIIDGNVGVSSLALRPT